MSGLHHGDVISFEPRHVFDRRLSPAHWCRPSRGRPASRHAVRIRPRGRVAAAITPRSTMVAARRGDRRAQPTVAPTRTANVAARPRTRPPITSSRDRWAQPMRPRTCARCADAAMRPSAARAPAQATASLSSRATRRSKRPSATSCGSWGRGDGINIAGRPSSQTARAAAHAHTTKPQSTGGHPDARRARCEL